MHDWRHILIGVDLAAGDELVADEPAADSLVAVRKGIEVAKAIGAELTFASVLNVPTLTTEDIVEESAEAALTHHAEEVLGKFVEQAKQVGVTAHARILTGRAWQALVHEAERVRPDLMLIGVGTKTIAKRYIFGGTALKLVRKCPTPVWIAGPAEGHDPPTILVADDLSDVGEECLRTAVALAQLMHARLLVLHAVEFPLDRRLFRTGVSKEELQAYREKVREDARDEVLERLRETDYRTVGPGVNVEIHAGPPDVVIEEAIEEHDVDLLIIGTSRKGGLASMLLGSTIESLLPRIECSLLAIKPDETGGSSTSLPTQPASAADDNGIGNE